MKKAFLILITIVTFILCLINYIPSWNVLHAQNKSIEEIPIEGVWTIHDKMKDFSNLLGLKKIPYYGTCCIDIKLKENKALIFFYSEKKPYEVKLQKISINEYEFINKNKKLGFIIWQQIDNQSSKVGLSPSKKIRMGIKDWDNMLRYDSHGQLGCLWENVSFAKCNSNEVEMCLKDAKETDDYYSQEKELPADLK